jgi:hypothetical protein
MPLPVESIAIEAGAVPINTTGAAVTGAYVSLKDYSHLTIIIHQGAWAGGTPAVTLKQATAIAGTGAKALSFAWRWTKVGISGTTFVKTAVTGDTFNLPATANTINVIEIDAEMLDTANDFDCLGVDVASPGANADLISITYLLSGPRYPQAVLADPKVD